MSDGSDDDVELGDVDMVDYDEQIQNVKQQLETNTDDMELLDQLMDLLKKNGDFDELQNLKTETSRKFPLSEKQWIEWATDLVAAGEPRAVIESVFEKAVFDRNSVNVWVEYAQWSIGLADLDYSRNCFENALTAVGLRFDCGHLIWHAYLALEEALHSGSEDEKQKDRVLSIYKRALRIPLKDIDEIWERYIGFAGDEDAEMKKIYSKTKNDVGKLLLFEKQLDKSESSLDGYFVYLDHEIESGDIGRIRSFYERIVEAHCADENAWSSYAMWCEKSIRDHKFSCRVYERAVRHCSYSAFLWQGLILACERADKPVEDVDKFWESAVCAIDTAQTGRSLYRTYLYHLRRRAAKTDQDYTKVSSAFKEGSKMLQEYFPTDWDASGEYRRNYAYFEFSLGKNLKKAREIWKDILSTGGGRLAEKWLEAIRCERRFGDVDSARALLYKAVNSVSDHPNIVFEYFIQFEREEGTIETLDKALDKVNSQIELRSKRPQKQVDDHKKKPKESSAEPEKRTVDRKRTPTQNDSSTGTPKKVPRLAKQESFAAKSPPSLPKKSVKDKDGFAMPTLPFKPSSSAPATEKREATNGSNEDPKHSVFISNLDFKITPERIQEVLDGVVEVRFLYRGSSKLHKGYGFVDLSSEKFVRAALAKDRTPIDGRPMFITINDKDKRVAFKYEKGLEKAKVFVRNVHYDCTEEQLKDALSIYGEIKDVRIVTHKSGKAKGCAFVEFVTEESAANAVKSETPVVLLERNLSIALSNPPKKGETTSSESFLDVPSDGSRKAHLQIVPRSLNVKRTTSTAKPAANMSNDQFRQFLKK